MTTMLTRLGLCAVLAFAVSCDKSGTTTVPDAKGTKGGTPTAGVELRYALKPSKVKQTGKFDVSTTGGGNFGQATLQYTAQLEFAPQGDKLKVNWAFADVSKLDAQGMFSEKDGGDAKAMLVSDGKGAFLVDTRGVLDEKASEGLAENAARRARLEQIAKDAQGAGGAGKPPSAAMQILMMADAMIALPDLPANGLEVGKSVTVEEQEDTELGGSGMVLPSDTETKYTLVKIDDAGGKRIAELQIEGVTSGATEVQGGMLTVDITTEGSMLFDLDAGLPVSYQFTRTQSFAFGQNTFESTMMMQASFAPV